MRTHHIPATPGHNRVGETGLAHTLRDTSSILDRYGLGFVPAGIAARREPGGPLVEGPWAYAYRLCNILDNSGSSGRVSDYRVTFGNETLFEMGDRLEINGYVFDTVPAPNNNMRLVLVEVETLAKEEEAENPPEPKPAKKKIRATKRSVNAPYLYLVKLDEARKVWSICTKDPDSETGWFVVREICEREDFETHCDDIDEEVRILKNEAEKEFA